MTSLHLSAYGERFTRASGTRQLMDDLGELQRAADRYVNLGGGNPSRIPGLHEWFLQQVITLGQTADLEGLFASYDDPRGYAPFISAVAEHLRNACGWPVASDNVVCTTGSQASFFMLYSLLSGPDANGRPRRILLPQSPEYIGYSDLGLSADAIVAVPSSVRITGEHRFKYVIDLESIVVDETIGAICISRPTNPTGNVVSDHEIAQLLAMARAQSIPLIVDCAYGEPFPGINFVPAPLQWCEDIVACLSLSKLGLPGLRTGIIVARSDLLQAVAGMSATIQLSGNSLGARVALDLFRHGEITRWCTDVIRPFYRTRAIEALALCDEHFHGLDYAIHESEGAIFLWVWFRGLPLGSAALYERLKARGVLVIPGRHFAPGRAAPPGQVDECIRLSYAQPRDKLAAGIKLIGEEVRRMFGRGPAPRR
jgi:valine--pyruvate aminotransferase